MRSFKGVATLVGRISGLVLLSTALFSVGPGSFVGRMTVADASGDLPTSTKSITRFSFPGVSLYTAVGDSTISAMVAYRTDVRGLAPTIDHGGVSISPASGVSQDFSVPGNVKYTVTAADGTTQIYAVTVTVQTELDSAKLSAYAALRSALAGYSSGNYSEGNWGALNGYKVVGDAAIEFSSDTNAVALVRTIAIDAMAGVPTNAELAAIDAATASVANAESAKTRESVSVSQTLVSALPSGSIKTALQSRLDAVRLIIDIAEATASVVIAEGSGTSENVSAAQTLVSALPSGSIKTALQSRLDAVRLAIDIAAATASVTTAESTDTRENVSVAQALVSALPNGSAKSALQNRIDIIRLTIDIVAATASVVIAEGSGTFETVSAAQTLVSALPNGSAKSSLQNRIDAVKATISADSVLVVSNLISSLPAVGVLALSDVTRISRARVSYDALTDSQKASISNYSVLQAAEAQFSILTTVTASVVTAEGTKVQENIRAAQVLVSALPNGSTKSALQNRIDAILSGIDLSASIASSKVAAHDALRVAFQTHREADYTSADWTTLRGFRTDGDSAINAASDVASSIAAKTTAIDSMAAIKTIAQTDPDPVKDLKAEYRTATKTVKLTWKVKGDTATEVYIYKGLTNHYSTKSREQVATQDIKDESYGDSDVSPGTTYYYKVSSVNIAGNAGDAETVKVVIPMNEAGLMGNAKGTDKKTAIGSGAVPNVANTAVAGVTTNDRDADVIPLRVIKNNGVVLGTSVEKTVPHDSFWGSIWMWLMLATAVFCATFIWQWRRFGNFDR